MALQGTRAGSGETGFCSPNREFATGWNPNGPGCSRSGRPREIAPCWLYRDSELDARGPRTGCAVDTAYGLYPGSYYRAQIPGLRVLLIVSILVPATSAAASVLSILAKPGNASSITASAIALFLALAVGWCCWKMGIDAVEEASRLAEEHGG